MVDIERTNLNKKSKGINLLNHIFKKRTNKMAIKCLSTNSSNDKLDNLLSKSLNNVNELNDNQIENLNLMELNNNQNNCTNNQNNNQLDLIRRLSIPILSNNQTKDELKINKKLSLKSRRSFSPKSKLIINQNMNQNKKLSLDQELLEHYRQLSTECNSSYMSLVSNSPISPRIKSIDQDIEQLTLSRTDNPFIQAKLEKLSSYSGVNYVGDILSISNLSLNGGFLNSTNTLNNLTQQSNYSNQLSNSNKTSSISSEELDEILNFGKSNKEDNLHQHLIRSPPPDFPTQFSGFIFPQIGSPLKNLSIKYNNSINSDTPQFLSPNKMKKNKISNRSPKNRENLFFEKLNKNKLPNKSSDNQLSNENEVELIITN